MHHTMFRWSIARAAMAVAASATTVLAGPGGSWAEGTGGSGDAGQNGVGAAQLTVGAGPLLSITGNLSGNNDVDLYAIRISNPSTFRATVSSFAGNDSVLYLFKSDGAAQVINDDDGTGSNLSLITNQGVFSTGVYYLGMASFANHGLNAGAGLVTDFAVWPGPDHAQWQGNGSVLTSWDNNGHTLGAYSIVLQGAEFVPAPGAAVLLGMAGLMASRRRRSGV